MTYKFVTREEMIEQLADIEHQRWSDWHIYSVKNETAENVTRWNRQAVTPYSRLSEHEKESDRREVRRYFPLIESLLAERDAYREFEGNSLSIKRYRRATTL